MALADLGNRGVLDVVVANQRGPLLLYRNRVDPARHWIAFELNGTASNRSAIGARVELSWERPAPGPGGERRQRLRRPRTSAGSTSGWAGPRAVDRVVIRWPSGTVETIEQPAVDRLHRIEEPS